MKAGFIVLGIELIILAYVCSISWKMLRNTFLTNIFRMLSISVGVLCSYGAHFITTHVLSPLITNVIMCFVIICVLDVAVFLLVDRLVFRWLKGREERRKKPGSMRRVVSGLVGKGLNIGLLAVFLTGVAAVLIFMVNLTGFLPIQDVIRERSLLLKYFLLPPEAFDEESSARHEDTPSETRDASLEETIDVQARFLSNLRRGLAKARDTVADKTGTKAVLTHVACLVEILDLPAHETMWLVESTPELAMLKENVLLLRIIEDDRLMDLIAQAGGGSMQAIYQIGDEPAIQALTEDETIMVAVRQLDLIEMRRKLRKHRIQWESKHVLPLIWDVSEINSSIELDAALANSGAWRRCEASAEYLEWDAGTKFALARAELNAVAPVDALIYLKTEGSPTLWVNGETVALEKKHARMEARVRFAKGRAELTAMIDFRTVSPPKRCRAAVIAGY